MKRISKSIDNFENKNDTLAWACLAKELGKKVGFDFTSSESIMGKIREETCEITEALQNEDPENLFEEIGDLLLAVVSLASHEGIDPSVALKRAVEKFSLRIGSVEEQILDQSKTWKDFTLEELEEFWKLSKVKTKR